MTPRIKKAYRHFNAFLTQYSCKQKFWRYIQKKANYEGVPYHIMKTKLLVCNRPQEWVVRGFTINPTFPIDHSIPWTKLDHDWYNYVQLHNYFLV